MGGEIVKIEIYIVSDGFKTYYKVYLNDDLVTGAFGKPLLFTKAELLGYLNNTLEVKK